MKSLIDIQQDVRAIENTLSTLTQQLGLINNALQQLSEPVDKNGIDFEDIKILAKRIPYKNHPIKEITSSNAQLDYLFILLNIVRLNEVKDINQFVFLQWLINESKLKYTLEQIISMGLKSDVLNLLKSSEVLSDQQKRILILDAMILSNLSETRRDTVFNYLADLCVIFQIEKENVKTYSQIARLILTQSYSKLKKQDADKIIKHSKNFMCYLSKDIFEPYFAPLRRITLQVPENQIASGYQIEWHFQSQKYVKKGTTIAKYKSRLSHFTIEVKASESGFLYKFKHNHTSYGVISHHDDDIEAIKTWARKNGGKS